MKALLIQQTLERLASVLRSETRTKLAQQGLQPVQFEALHYLSICNRYSDTPMAVTEFLGQTKGTVSQTIKVLEKKGLVEKEADSKDKRVTHLKVTAEGKALIEEMLPSKILQETCLQFSEEGLSNLSTTVVDLLRTLQKVNDFKTFGLCSTCLHNIKLEGGKYLCNLTKDPLSDQDIEMICREHASN